jgi:hypothetical protein
VKIVPAIPVRHERSVAFVTRQRGCSMEEIRSPVFDLSPRAEKLHALRLGLGLGLRDAASQMGIRAVELSGLERGRMVPSRAADWALLEERLVGSGSRV